MGGEALVRSQALKAMELSKNRAGEIRKLLIERYSLDPKRLDIVGRGWEEPAGPNSDLNRRVEVLWFTDRMSAPDGLMPNANFTPTAASLRPAERHHQARDDPAVDAARPRRC